MRRVLKLAGSEVRIYECEHHFIVYLADDTAVIIIAFLHERMDFVARLKARLLPQKQRKVGWLRHKTHAPQ
jgi:hypothetical protein